MAHNTTRIPRFTKLLLIKFGNFDNVQLQFKTSFRNLFVLADGTILEKMTAVGKDKTGYDLKHFFIGSDIYFFQMRFTYSEMFFTWFLAVLKIENAF